MKFHLPITTLTVLWILDFAAHLVLLVVLLGRDRVRRFPWFTAGIAFTALQLLMSQLLMGRIPPQTAKMMFLGMAGLTAFFNLLVALEIARRAFGRVARWKWLVGGLAAIAVGAAVLAVWGRWPTLEMLRQSPPAAVLQFIAQKGLLLGNVEWAFVGLLVVVLGSRVGAGLRTHVQQVAIGLMTAAMAQMGVQILWERIASAAMTRPVDEQYKALHLLDRLQSADRVIYLLVLVWWIACLWRDEQSRDKGTEGQTDREVLPGDGGLHGRALPEGREHEGPEPDGVVEG